MRVLIAATAFALLAVPAWAQTTPAPATTPATTAPATTAPPVAAAPPAATADTPPATPPVAPKKMVGHHRQTLQQHFEAANTAHDGHLTKDQATAAKWSYVTKHFAAMDTANKGYVTADDIHAYAHAQRIAHHKPAPATAPAAAPATNS